MKNLIYIFILAIVLIFNVILIFINNKQKEVIVIFNAYELVGNNYVLTAQDTAYQTIDYFSYPDTLAYASEEAAEECYVSDSIKIIKTTIKLKQNGKR